LSNDFICVSPINRKKKPRRASKIKLVLYRFIQFWMWRWMASVEWVMGVWCPMMRWSRISIIRFRFVMAGGAILYPPIKAVEMEKMVRHSWLTRESQKTLSCVRENHRSRSEMMLLSRFYLTFHIPRSS
jgi:hypothetical protein